MQIMYARVTKALQVMIVHFKRALLEKPGLINHRLSIRLMRLRNVLIKVSATVLQELAHAKEDGLALPVINVGDLVSVSLLLSNSVTAYRCCFRLQCTVQITATAMAHAIRFKTLVS